MSIIGPGMTLDDYESGRVTPIDVFEGRIKHWTLAFARLLAKEKDSGIAVLLLTSSVFEPMGGVLLGSGNSESKFCAGFVRAFPDVPGSKSAEDVGKMVCDLLRDGLFHESSIKAGLIVEASDEPIRVSPGAVHVDPMLFLDVVESTFAKLCEAIRSADPGSKARQTFDLYWSKKLEDQRKYVEARLDSQALEQYATSTSTLAPMGHKALISKADGSFIEIGESGRERPRR
jgi:hypothetical protein